MAFNILRGAIRAKPLEQENLENSLYYLTVKENESVKGRGFASAVKVHTSQNEVDYFLLTSSSVISEECHWQDKMIIADRFSSKNLKQKRNIKLW